jgi:hypothetical protein
MLQEFVPDIVVTDTLNAYFGAGDESATEDMTRFCATLRRLRDVLGCSIHVIHHTGHEGIRERGSTVLRATADVMIQVAKDENGSGAVGVQVTHARDLESWEHPIALKLQAVDTEWLDEDGEPMSTCIVIPSDMPVTLPGKGAKKLGDAQAALLQVIHRMAVDRPRETDGRVLLARHEVSLAAQKDGVNKKSISSAWAPLAKRHLIALSEPGSLLVHPSRTGLRV